MPGHGVLVRSLMLVLVLCAAFLGACSDDRLVVLTASSLSDVTETLVDAAGIDAVVSAAGSQTLVAQVTGGAPADVLLLADPELARTLADNGRASRPQVVATTTLAIAVRPDRSDAVTGPVDLARQQLRVVLADASVPLGRYTRAAYRALEETGQVPAGTLDAVLAGAESFEDAARPVLTKVQVGEADAAIVFAADRRLADELVFVPWPEDVDVRYTVQTLEGSDRAADAAQLMAFLASDRAAPLWQRAGFAVP